MEITNYYEKLGLNQSDFKNITFLDIKRAYKKLVKEHHPDKGGDAEIFKEIQIAYDVLSNSETKELYDNAWFDEDSQKEILEIYENILLPEMVDNINGNHSMREVIRFYITQEKSKWFNELDQLKWSKDSLNTILNQTLEPKENSISSLVKKLIQNKIDDLEKAIFDATKKANLLESALIISKDIFK